MGSHPGHLTAVHGDEEAGCVFIMLLDLLISMCMFACTMDGRHVYALCPQRSEKGIRNSAAGATDGYRLPCVCWEQNLGLLKSSNHGVISPAPGRCLDLHIQN